MLSDFDRLLGSRVTQMVDGIIFIIVVRRFMCSVWAVSKISTDDK